MRETDSCTSGSGQVADRTPVLSAATVPGWIDDLLGVDRDASDAERVDQIAELEKLKSAAAAAQAKLTADLDASQRAAQEATGLPKRRVGAGIAGQVALARRESPHLGQRHLGLAKTLVGEMPHTLRALEQGRLGEWQATLLARETGHLSLEHRRHVDRMLCADPDRLEGLGPRQLVAAAQKLALKLDPEAVVRRHRKAATQRRVSVRPAPDTMTWVSGLLPAGQGVAVYAALSRAADTARAAGDPRTRPRRRTHRGTQPRRQVRVLQPRQGVPGWRARPGPGRTARTPSRSPPPPATDTAPRRHPCPATASHRR